MYARVEADYLEDLESLADADLLRRAKFGNAAALSELLTRHSEALFRFCRHIAASQEDAEDIFQETMARAIARVNSVQTGASFRSWLFRIAKNLSVDTFRSRKRTCPLPDEEITPLPVFEDGPQDSVETGEEHETVAHALTQLAESHQRVLVLREVEGLSYAAIAQKLNVSQSAVETLLFRARRRLREEYAKHVAAVPAVAALAALRGAIARLAAPLVGGPPILKVAATAAVVGTVAVSAPQMVPMHPPPRAVVVHHTAASRHLPTIHSQPQSLPPATQRSEPMAASPHASHKSAPAHTISRHPAVKLHRGSVTHKSPRRVTHSSRHVRPLRHPRTVKSVAPASHPARSHIVAGAASAPRTAPVAGSQSAAQTSRSAAAPRHVTRPAGKQSPGKSEAPGKSSVHVSRGRSGRSAAPPKSTGRPAKQTTGSFIPPGQERSRGNATKSRQQASPTRGNSTKPKQQGPAAGGNSTKPKQQTGPPSTTRPSASPTRGGVNPKAGPKAPPSSAGAPVTSPGRSAGARTGAPPGDTKPVQSPASSSPAQPGQRKGQSSPSPVLPAAPVAPSASAPVTPPGQAKGNPNGNRGVSVGSQPAQSAAGQLPPAKGNEKHP